MVGTINDYTTNNCGGNIDVVQLSSFDWTNLNASSYDEINCMTSYGNSPGLQNAPAGWYGHCYSGDNGTSQGCSWKSRAPFSRGGNLYLPVARQIPAGTPAIHDATIIISTNGGVTWRNPYSVAHSVNSSATGDAPLCGATNGNAGSNCVDSTYSGSIMWPALPVGFYNWEPVQYGQDGSMPSGVTDGCDPTTYTCLVAGEEEMTIARVANSDLPSLDVTKYSYYTCPGIGDSYRCPGSLASSWTTTFANRTPIKYVPHTVSQPLILNGMFGIAYLKEFGSYIMTGFNGASNTVFLQSPNIYGPWTTVLISTSVVPGFLAPSLALGYTVVSANPPHVQITTVQDLPGGVHNAEGTPTFAKWDLILGKTPALNGGENSRYTFVGSTVSNAGCVFSNSHAPGTIPSKDLVWAWDMYDYGGNTNSTAVTGFHDIYGGGAYLVPCQQAGCGGFIPGQGTNLTNYGAQIVNNGYYGALRTVAHDSPTTIAAGSNVIQNANFATGNSTFTIALVFRYDSNPGGGYYPIWNVGTESNDHSIVTLSFLGAGTNLSIQWALSSYWSYAYNSAYTLTAGNWYFAAVTIKGTTLDPTAHLWLGNSGKLTDMIAAVSRTPNGGSPTQLPNVVAGPLSLGTSPQETAQTPNASYASLFAYSRDLTRFEIDAIYQTMKKKMALRGVTIQ